MPKFTRHGGIGTVIVSNDRSNDIAGRAAALVVAATMTAQKQTAAVAFPLVHSGLK